MPVTLGAPASRGFILSWLMLLCILIFVEQFEFFDMPGASLSQQRVHGAHNSGTRWLGRYENNGQLLQEVNIDFRSVRDDLGMSVINCLHSAPLDLGRSLNCLHSAPLDLGRSLNCLHLDLPNCQFVNLPICQSSLDLPGYKSQYLDYLPLQFWHCAGIFEILTVQFMPDPNRQFLHLGAGIFDHLPVHFMQHQLNDHEPSLIFPAAQFFNVHHVHF